MQPQPLPLFPAPCRRRYPSQPRSNLLALVAGLAMVAWLPVALQLHAEDTIEQMLPENRQRQPLRYEALRQNNNAIFVGTAEKGQNFIFNVKVHEVLKKVDQRAIEIDDVIDVQSHRQSLKNNQVYLFPVYIWGNNNPAMAQAAPIELRKDFRNDPIYKVLKFTIQTNQPSEPAAFTAAVWALYQSIPQQNFLDDGRLDLLAYVAQERADRIDPAHAEFAAEIDRVLHQELLGNPEKLRAVEADNGEAPRQFERALSAAAKLYALRADVKIGAELSILLAATPLSTAACNVLIERCEDKDKPEVGEKLLPLIESTLKEKRVDRRAVQVLYLARLLKSDKVLAPIKKALEEDIGRQDALLLGRTLLAAQGEAAWDTVSPLCDRVFDWQNNSMYLQSDLIRIAIEQVGKKSYPKLVQSIRKNPNLQNMIYQIFNGMPEGAREDFGYELLEAGIHNALPFMLQNKTTSNPRLIEFVLRYAVGEVQADDENTRNMLANASMNARQFLRNQLNCEVATRAAFNDWYLDRLSAVNLPLSDDLKNKLPAWTRDLASPIGDVRLQAQKEIRNLGPDALPALLQLEHETKDLTTRQTARAMILQLPLIAEAFTLGQ